MMSPGEGHPPGGFPPPQPAAVPDLSPGTAIEQYEIDGVLGRGGFGTVYRAMHRTLREPFAVKAMGAFGQSESMIRTLASEYKAQKRIKNINVLESEAPVACTHQGVDWVLLPMELAEKSFRDWLKDVDREREDWLQEGLEILRQVCRGVQSIHDAGLVHLDLKPENVLLVRDGEGWIAKVGDFGLSRGLAKLEEVRPELFQDGVGTPAYMAPEQVMAAHYEDVDASADVYAIGMMLFELLKGRLPYSGSGESIKQKKLNRELSIGSPGGPAHLAALALALIDRDAESRPKLSDVTDNLVAVTPKDRVASEVAEKADREESHARYVKEPPEGVRRGEAEEGHGTFKAAPVEALEKAEAEREEPEEADQNKGEEAVSGRVHQEERRKEEVERPAKAEAERGAWEEAEAEGRARAEAEQAPWEEAEAEGRARAEVEQAAWEEAEAEGRARAEAEQAPWEEAERRSKEEGQRATEELWGDLASLGLGEEEFVRIPAGSFTMGDSRFGPEHRVRITRDFLLQRTPVTQAQWMAVMGENPSHFTGDDRRPVESVNRADAKAFINKVNEKVTPGTFRLPTEAEWEYACRAGTTDAYGGTGRLEDMGWYEDNSGSTTHPVAQKLANAWALFDMHGNVFELCHDRYDADYYDRSPRADPPGPAGSGAQVTRGGCAIGSADEARSAFRYYLNPELRVYTIGFRLARTV